MTRAVHDRRTLPVLGLAVGLALAGVARAEQPVDTAPQVAALAAGDLAWCTGRRGDAARAWRAATDGDDAATTAMAEIRLVQVSGTWGLLAHGPRADEALARCPLRDPRCALARADYEIVLSRVGLGGDRSQAQALVARAAPQLPHAALARQVWLGEQPVSRLDAQAEAADGLAAALAASGGSWPRGPGTWTVGLGAAGAPGLGVGGGLRFAHPDLLWRGWHLDVEGSLSTRGNQLASARLQTAGTLWLSTGARYQRAFTDRWAADADADDGPVSTVRSTGVDAWLAPGLRRGGGSVWLGPLYSTESVATVPAATTDLFLRGPGLVGGLAWEALAPADPFGQRGGTSAVLTGRTTVAWLDLADHTRRDGSLVLSYGTGLGRSFLASRVGVQLGDADHAWHLPAAGGGVWLRGAPAGRFSGPVIAALAVEARTALNEWIQVAAFAEGVDVDGLHGDVGAGLRVALPPRPLNTLRLDVAVGDVGWALTGGIGQPF